MKVTKLDHVNLQTTQLDEMVAWYGDVLGMRPGPRPNFPFPGAWLYAGDAAVIHLVGFDGEPATGSETKLKLEHFSLKATGLDVFLARLGEKAIAYKRADLPEANLVLVNIWDPDGNHIHVDFPADA